MMRRVQVCSEADEVSGCFQCTHEFHCSVCGELTHTGNEMGEPPMPDEYLMLVFGDPPVCSSCRGAGRGGVSLHFAP